MRRFVFDIDVAAACNLRCPCCPQGNLRDLRPPRGFMPPDLFARILHKARTECLLSRVSLFSWGEPLLHPRLPELIRMVREAGVESYLSTNLNHLPDPDALMAENPSHLRISLSGFSQQVYGYTHAGGDIARVKRHMVALAEARQRQNAATRIYVYYHRYRDNLKEEPLMRQFAADLGFGFQPVWALFFPLEKILAHLEGEVGSYSLSTEDRRLLDHLAVPLEEAVAAGQAHRGLPCPLRDDALYLDYQGNVLLCCGVYDSSRFTLGRFLDLPLEEIQKIRENHPLCGRCMPLGIHRYLIHGFHQLSELALPHIAPEDAQLLDLPGEITRQRRRQRLAGIYHRLFARFLTPEQRQVWAKRCSRVESLISR